MSSDIAIHLDGISKRFAVYSSPAARLISLLFRQQHKAEFFEAVKPLNLIVRKGEFLGIIGENGSGKSTLLQIIAGILSPSSGRMHVEGRVGALLELGAGFNPEFTGRENARLNAAILGLTDSEFEQKLPEIMAFADIGEFFDKPVKTYSSGMYVRLAFAVQACVEPDILIVDEALAVGDIFFRLKCYERLERLRKNGCTVILVTHSMEDVIHYCDHALLLHHGEVLYQGDVMEAVSHYYALGNLKTGETPATDEKFQETLSLEEGAVEWPRISFIDLSSKDQVTDGSVACRSIALTDASGKPQRIFKQGDTVHIYAEFEALRDLETVVAGVVIRSEKGVILHGKHSGQDDLPVPRFVKAGTRLRCRHDIELSIHTGEYLVDVTIGGYARQVYEARNRMTMAELESAAYRHCVVSAAATLGVIPAASHGFAVQPFYGLANLSSRSHITQLTAR
ncbi:ABC transporter ATP-binding protein [Affinirhizobium pseudoryzae]|uniref:ABC transporter ATP-binding protein n=1 Tax=Allorhizobium pseudoryzae TaxID=379684 RepID=UPI0013ECFCB8|nr:ABC transporter ATP-binding protein [Allorhizobium pseudoryzae]